MKNEIVLNATARMRQLRRLLFLLVMYGSVATSSMAGVVIKGNVYGGGNAASVGTTVQTDSAVVNISNPNATVWGQVFGGCNTEGSVIGTAVVDITAGTIGKPDTIQNVVFGGGKGQHTLVKGSVVVNIGKMTTGENPTPSGSATIWGHVYGGSAFGIVNAKISGNDTTRVGDSTTVVNIISGTVKGDIYGGGLGQKAAEAVPAHGNPGDDDYTPAVEAVTAIAANVYGQVTVNIGSGTAGNATIGGSVYGCNNLNGTPKDSVFVNIYKTAHTAANTYPTENDATDEDTDVNELSELATLVANYDAEGYSDKFAIAAVYGGGNQASYSPNDDKGTTTVHVYACAENTIHTLYGGGNAADATHVKVIIDGGFIDRVFGGGNGYSATGNHTRPNEANYNPGADITGSATTEIHGGLFRQIFGGSNQYGDVAKVALSIDNESNCTELIHESFGGANEAVIKSNVTTTLACSNNHIGSFYGGSNLANITGNVTLNVEGGTYINVFGGSKGRADDPSTSDINEAVSANINGDVTLNLYGGTMVNAFGGSDVNGNITGKITVNVLDKGGDCGLQVDSIYGGGRDAAYTPTTQGAYPEVNLIHGKISGNVFGGGLGSSAIVTSNPKVTVGYVARTSAMVDSLVALAGASFNDTVVVRGDVYGGGSAAAVTGKTTVLLRDSCCSVSNLFGGGKAAGVSDSTWVTMTAGTVTNAVYGGCNASGTVGGAPTVTVTGGTIGTAYASDPTSMDGIRQVLFGGGKGKDTDVTGKITLNVGTKTGSDYAGTAHIYGNVYGGSENGKVSNVDVFLYGDTIHGNVFGGGYDTDASLVALPDTLAKHATAADTINVLLDGTKFDRTYNNMAQIFGCNNKSGTPKGLVTVHVKRTVGSDKNEETPVADRNVYDIAAVYGGGNMADYVPRGETDSTHVIIEGCGLTSIEYVYGGGNAAAVSATGVDIKGSYIINQVFGGGNGAGQILDSSNNWIANPGANVGSYINGTDSIPYGTGRAVTKLYGGNIYYVFGGSNTLGNIRQTVVETKQQDTSSPDGCDILNVVNIYGAGSMAEMTGDVNIIMECMPEAYVDAVFGGAKNAVINGNVTLTVTSGKFGRVFGGNNEGGSINGTIKVIAKEGGCEPLEIGELYGGGNQAPYSIHGCHYDTDNDKWVVNNDDTTYVADSEYAIEVIVESCTSIGKVFGGGNLAEVVGDTHVDINMFKGLLEGDDNQDDTFRPLGRIGQVFGGGNLANVIGNTTIDIGTDGEATDSNNKVPEGEQKGVQILAGDTIDYIDPDHNAYIHIPEAGIYGGGNNADVEGNTTLNIGTEKQSLGININGNIFGGGYGKSTTVTGDVTVNIGANNGTAASPRYVGYANIIGDVYGGSAKGKVNANRTVTGNDSTYSASGDTTRVYLYGGIVKGNVYGGGMGDTTSVSRIAADVYGPVFVTVEGGKANNVFGCNNYFGAPKDTVRVVINNTDSIGNVYGGGNLAEYEGTPAVVMNGGTVNNVFGGGLGTTAIIHGNTDVSITGGTVNESVFGGGHEANVTANTNVNMSGGTIAQNVFGGGKGKGDNFTCDKAMVGTEVSNNACEDPGSADNKDKGTHVTISNGTVQGNVYGGGEVGRVEWNTQVTIGVDTVTAGPIIEGDVFGAGKGLKTHGYSALVRGNSIVTIQGSTKVGENVYGGGEIATVGRYWVSNIPVSTYCEDEGSEPPTVPEGLAAEMPYKTRRGGKCTVTVQGNAEIGYNGASATAGHVFGAGKGVDSLYRADGDYKSMRMVTRAERHTSDNEGTLWGASDDSRFVWEYFVRDNNKSDTTKYYEFLQTLALVTETHVKIDNSAIVNGSVYGGSESGFVQDSTDVIIAGGTIGPDTLGNVFGGGKGFAEFAESGIVKGNTKVTISGNNTLVNGVVYGGGELGDVSENTEVNINGGTIAKNVFGGGKGKADNFTCDKAMVGINDSGEGQEPGSNANKDKGTHVTITAGTVNGSVYGGGEVGRVEWNTHVTIGDSTATSGTNEPTIVGSVFGAGAGVETHGYSALVRGNSTVDVQGNARVKGNVYGGGEKASGGRYYVKGFGTQADPLPDNFANTPQGMPYKSKNGGVCTVNILGSAIIGPNNGNATATAGHVFGAGKGVEPHFIAGSSYRIDNTGKPEIFNIESKYLEFLQTLALVTNSFVTIGERSTVMGNVYGGSENGFVQDSTSIRILGGTIGTPSSDYGNIYGGGKGLPTFDEAGRVGGSTAITVSGGTTTGSIFGGGELGYVKKNVGINIAGGRIYSDVYGGGALANTNTENWNPDSTLTTPIYYVVSGLTSDSSVVGYYMKPYVYTEASGNAIEGVTYYQNTGGTYSPVDVAVGADVSSYYTRALGDNYVEASGTANADTIYYKKVEKGTWARGKSSSTYKTTINLTGGLIGSPSTVGSDDDFSGNVYGGGLGRLAHDTLSAVEAMVYGDINMTLNGTAFIQKYKTPPTSTDPKVSNQPVPFSGRLFGCNNLNGTPKGDVTVTVWRTKRVEGESVSDSHSDNEFEVHSVYGGGNMASYQPMTGKSTRVRIHGCEDTSIEKVFGGGNSAYVPSTDVIIYSCLNIGYAFGGGNGADRIYKEWKTGDARWEPNEGAPVYGNAQIIALGGKIGQVFSGSDTKGKIYGTATIKLKGGEGDQEYSGDEQDEGCPLKIINAYGAGRGADIESDVNMIVSGCGDGNSSVERVFGGSYDANIKGNINLTITSGIYSQVFGGNDHGGAIGGNINVNIEETDNCKPIIIQYLYGGGREAAYPGNGAKNKSNADVSRGKITVNVKSATRIDNVFGGSYRALINGDTEVNINMIKGNWVNNEFTFPDNYRGDPIPNATGTVTYSEVQDLSDGSSVTGYYSKETVDGQDVYTKIENPDTVSVAGGHYYKMTMTGKVNNDIGTIGNVFGGSFESAVKGNATVNIGTESTVKIMKRNASGTILATDDESIYDNQGRIRDNIQIATVDSIVLGAHITGNVYGGGNLANVGDYHTAPDPETKAMTDYIDYRGKTFVNICAKGDAAVAEGESKVTIAGNVYGGGRGLADVFRCGKAMVTDSTNVRIGNGTVGTLVDGKLKAGTGNVYGGGMVGRVEESTAVTVGLTPETGKRSAPVIRGSIFGAGQGVETHGYSALVRGNSIVTVQEKSKVGQSVYGGGELASVGRYSVADSAYHSTHPDVGIGMPYSLANPNSGNCYVIVLDSAEIGPDDMQMPQFTGHVFGAGKGIVPFKDTNDPKRMLPTNAYEVYGTDTTAYLKYAETLALATKAEVTIGGDAFVKGSVYGGSENGHVQHDTKVRIQDHCQIGAGYDYNTKKSLPMYDEATVFVHPSTTTVATSVNECNHWPYGKGTTAKYVPYDKYADQYTSYASTTGDDGHTYYGNVFGGGSGKDPYAPGKWHWEAGSVGGNATVEISGGHILTNVYGGNELTSVKDTCFITMTGGTLGVPRTLDSIAAHPVTCYLFGAGKGDQRVFFNKQTNVKDVIVDVSGGIIYGSVFGGGEDGHIMRNAKVNIKPGAWIGTWGTSYVDGNVFGGGRGFAGDAYTAGNVADSVVVNITGGTMLGSIYGGGRLGSVGYDLVEAGNGRYGQMSDNLNRGHVVMNISGGKIGNKYEFTTDTVAAYIPYTEFDSNHRLSHTKGGNVYAGGMGRFTKLNGDSISLANDGIDWTKLGNVKSTKLSISDSTWIMGNVYGGGELGAVTDSTVIKVTGGVIGTEITAAVPDSTTHAAGTAGTEVAYTFGSIYGGGMGMVMHDKRDNHGGEVANNTHVSISGDDTKVRASVFGGGEMATVGGDTYVDVSNGKIGRNQVNRSNDENDGYVMFGGATMGNVFGGGKGHVDHTFAGLVKGNTNISISGGSIYHNVYGGGALGSVGTFDVAKGLSYIPDGVPLAPWESGGTARITITGGTIGISGRDNGMVFGSSRGGIAQPVPTTLGSKTVYKDPYDKVAWVYDTEVTIGSESSSAGPNIKGSVYGGGENGHNAHNALVNVYSGNVGIVDSNDPWYTLNPAAAAAAEATRGNVYGAGCGTDTYTDSQDKKQHHNLWAGIVSVNTEVNVRGGHVARNVYGAGSMGSVGTIISDIDSEAKWHKENDGGSLEAATTFYNFGLSWPIEIEYVETTGLARVNVDSLAVVDGSVYGAARGKVDIEENDITRHRYVEAKFANVRQTEVNIGITGNPEIKEDVFGGGEDGHVYDNAVVNIYGGTVAHSVYGGGKGEGTYMATLWEPKDGAENDITQHQEKSDSIPIHSMVAGKVYGNTTVTIRGGQVGWFVYGGGNLGSVGKGNYAGGADDYATGGYGELPENDATANLWTTAKDSTMAWYFLNSGVATVNLFGGTIGTYEGSESENFDPVDQLPYGSVFGGSRGKSAMDVGQRSPRYRYVPDFFLGYVNKAIINVGDTSATATGNGPKICGSIYGGGQDGHVRNSTHVNLFKGEVTGHQVDAAGRSGHVFGAGSGIGTYLDTDGKQKVSFASGSVTCTTQVDVYDGMKIKGNIWGGGAMAAIGPPKMGTDEGKEPSGTRKSFSYTKVDVKGGEIGGTVYGASRGPSAAFRKARFTDIDVPYDSTKFATDIWSEVIVRGGTIGGSVFGGGESGQVKCGVNVNILGGQIGSDVYGGGALAHTNTSNLKQDRTNHKWGWSDSGKTTGLYTTTVNLLGGTIQGNAYGGALGRREFIGTDTIVTPVEAKVYGDIKVNLNGIEAIDSTSIRSVKEDVKSWLVPTIDEHYQVNSTRPGASVSRVFGCNNLNGSPQGKVRVHVFATQNDSTQNINTKYEKFRKRADYTIDNYSDLTALAAAMNIDISSYVNNLTNTNDDSLQRVALNAIIDTIAVMKYDVRGVYGGGNLAAYMPMGPNPGTDGNGGIIHNNESTKQSTDVIIDGCELTSIYQVYGGGNAAPVPAAHLVVNGTYEIDEAFGGGNGADSYWVVEGNDTVWYQNPGANVGYKDFTEVVKDASHDGKTEATAYLQRDVAAASTPEMRKAGFSYGDQSTAGVATTIINGGKIHVVYGGSNKRGNISTTALSQYEGASGCPMDVDETYGAGKDAPIDGNIDMRLKCAKGVKEMFGGSKNSDVNSDIVLNITNGSSLERVFGGNNTSGAINGSITVNIVEDGCEPIHIGELYAGGYLAPYSIYGYAQGGEGGYLEEEIDYGGTIGKIKQRIPITRSEYEDSIKGSYEGYLKNDLDSMGFARDHVPTEQELQEKINSTTPKVARAALEYVAIRDLLASLPKKHPRINVISATRIDTIYGGGYQAKVVGNPRVNVNMTNGKVEVTKTESGKFVDASGNEYPAETVDTNLVATLPIGTIGHIFGGGNMANIEGNTFVEIGTGEWLNQNDQREMLGTVTLNAKDTTMLFTYDDSQQKWTYTQESGDSIVINGVKTARIDTIAIDTIPTPFRRAATITGNVFGGGRGVADNFFCDKAMIGTDGAGVDKDFNDIPDYLEGNTSVTIANGTVGGNVYGGGEIGRVEKNTTVIIGLEDDAGEPVIEGDVYGAGKGVETHGYSALVRGNPTVIIQGKAKVGHSVYGGGQTASVARYKVVGGSPVALANSTSGNCKVIVRGEAEIGPDSMVMTKPGGPDDTGYVFGAGKGVIPGDSSYVDIAHMPKRMILRVDTVHTADNPYWEYVYSSDNPNIWEYFPNDSIYLSFIETLALSSKTDVTIGGHAFVKGSVYGGSENGLVQYDTHVRIQDSCQIGNGYVQMNEDGTPLATPLSMDRRYTTQEWEEGRLIIGENDRQALKVLMEDNPQLYQHSLPECASWPYEAPYATYDRLADENGLYPDGSNAQGGRISASDGHTFYGNVFGGGSGLYPFRPGKWHRAAGLVRGNTVVDVTGGHILTSLYGGNEMTDVGTYQKDSHGELTIPDTCGICTINMVGGTLGVPRTLGQIAAHPVTCYLFGAGKGDPRTFFNTWTNVDSVTVNISGNARIYGSTFGGGEDGHILESVVTNIGLPVTLNIDGKDSVFTENGVLIGTTGYSYVDGNVFGAGRGFSGDAITAGSVGGNVEVNIGGGTMLGSIYGGGRLASVGIGFNAPEDANYGSFTADDPDDNTKTYGHVTVNISGGTIGHDSIWTQQYGGNVFGGSMGRLTHLDNTVNPIWSQLGQVKTTEVNITGGTIKRNVYGGGEFGSVRDSAYVNIGGRKNADGTITAEGSPVIERDVYGGGYGSKDTLSQAFITPVSGMTFRYTPMQWAGLVGISTHVNMLGGWVKKSIYGGGELASVGIINYLVEQKADGDYTYSGTVDSLKGKKFSYINIEKHDDENDGFYLSWPYKFEYFPGYDGSTHIAIRGGRLGLTGKDFMGPFNAEGKAISLADGHVLDKDEEKAARVDNGDIYGGSKGFAGDRYYEGFSANVGSTEIVIDYPETNTANPGNYKKKEGETYANDCIAGAVYGGGENGHVLGDTHLTLTNGLIGHALYGGGSGKGQFEQRLLKVKVDPKSTNPKDSVTVNIYSITAGKVYGNTHIDMTGGYVVRNIYGGGNMGSVGKGNYAGAPDDYSHNNPGGGYGEKIVDSLWTGRNPNSQAFLNSGQTNVTVTGGQVGYVDTVKISDSMKDGLPYGNVFGGCRGESAPNITESPRFLYSPQFFSGYINKSNVTIGTEGQDNSKAGQKGKAPLILGSVFGGGQDGHVRQDTYVTVNSGQIGLSLNGMDLDSLNKSQTNLAILGALYKDDNTVNPQWLYRGNVFGAGSGIGQYEFDFNYDGDTTDSVYYGLKPRTTDSLLVSETGYSTSAGSVTRFTNVDVKGGVVYRNVYGGGSLASVGPAKIPATRADAWHPNDTIANHRDSVGWQSLNSVTIGGLTVDGKVVRPQIGDAASVNAGYGGNIFGGGRGELSIGDNYGTSVWTKVYIKNGANILGNVFGGGDNGTVYKDTDVQIGEPKNGD